MIQKIFWKKVEDIPAHDDILERCDLVFIMKCFHHAKRKGSGHYDLYILKLIDLLGNFFRLLFAMVAFRAKTHEDGDAVAFQVFGVKVGAAVGQ